LKRKFQVCNGYLFEFDQLARILHYLGNLVDVKYVLRKDLIENTGLANRQIESLVSIGCAVGLILPGKQTLSDFGKLVVKHDNFLEQRGTLEWLHFQGAANRKNLIWFEAFNTLLVEIGPTDQKGWMQYLRESLAGEYTDKTIGKHLSEEVRFVVDSYLEKNFNKLELLHKTSDGILYRKRYSTFTKLIFAAVLYTFGDREKSNLIQLKDLSNRPSSPGLVFYMDENYLRELTEELHKEGWIRYEGTHRLDQIRLIKQYSSIEFLNAYYNNRQPTKIPNLN
jgi:hypothetical protein